MGSCSPRDAQSLEGASGRTVAASSDGEEEHRRFGPMESTTMGKGPAWILRCTKISAATTDKPSAPSLEAKEETRRPRTGRRMGATGSGGKKRGRLVYFGLEVLNAQRERTTLLSRSLEL